MRKQSLLTIALLVFLTAFIAALIWIVRLLSDSASAVGLVGVLVGAAIPTVTSYLQASQDRRTNLAMAALDKRLAAHQEAFAHWRKIFRAMHQPDLNKELEAAQTWWEENCLYLDAKSRKAFHACIMAAYNHKSYLDGPRSEDNKKLVTENWGVIMRPGIVLVEGVNLPGLPIDLNPEIGKPRT